MTRYTESIEIDGPPSRVWELIATPERWSEGYLATRFRASNYPQYNARNDYLYRTRTHEDVAARVIRSQPPSLLEEAQRGTSFSRRVRYRLEPAGERTRVIVEDQISFLGAARLAPALDIRDARARWRRSLERLRDIAEQP